MVAAYIPVAAERCTEPFHAAEHRRSVTVRRLGALNRTPAALSAGYALDAHFGLGIAEPSRATVWSRSHHAGLPRLNGPVEGAKEGLIVALYQARSGIRLTVVRPKGLQIPAGCSGVICQRPIGEAAG